MIVSDFLIVDGIKFNIHVKTGVKRTADFLYKYANRQQTGWLESELIGVYFNFSNISFEKQTDKNYNEYNSLYDKLTEPNEKHTITIANFTFQAYFANVSDEIYGYKNGRAYFKNLTVEFKAVGPART